MMRSGWSLALGSWRDKVFSFVFLKKYLGFDLPPTLLLLLLLQMFLDSQAGSVQEQPPVEGHRNPLLPRLLTSGRSKGCLPPHPSMPLQLSLLRVPSLAASGPPQTSPTQEIARQLSVLLWTRARRSFCNTSQKEGPWHHELTWDLLEEQAEGVQIGWVYSETLGSGIPRVPFHPCLSNQQEATPRHEPTHSPRVTTFLRSLPGLRDPHLHPLHFQWQQVPLSSISSFNKYWSAYYC